MLKIEPKAQHLLPGIVRDVLVWVSVVVVVEDVEDEVLVADVLVEVAVVAVDDVVVTDDVNVMVLEVLVELDV